MKYFIVVLSIVWFVFGSSRVLAQNTFFTISGYVRDSASGETLIGVNISLPQFQGRGTVSNEYGFYSLQIPTNATVVRFSYTGFNYSEIKILSSINQRLNVNLIEGILVQEVVVTAKQADKNVESTEMSTISLSIDKIKKIPAMFGEVDILKALQLLPGVQFGNEGFSGFFVRGGAPDQNLVLLDEANVYNAGHMLGFFSVFNSDAIKNVTLYKGGMPASYGGRLSSVLDIQMKEGNMNKYKVEGGIGIVSSRLTIEGPLQKNKSSFLISGRRTYLFDLIQPVLKSTNFAGTNYYFYDLNLKVNHRFSDKDRLYFSGYFGRDILTFRSSERDFSLRLPYGNSTATMRWNHLFHDKLFMNLSLIYNDYDFSLGGGQGDFQVDVFSGVRDLNLKLDFDYFPSDKHTISYGLWAIHHTLTPNIAQASNGEISFKSPLKPKYGLEYAAYVQDDIKWNSKWSTNIGLRVSAFTQVGPYTSDGDKVFNDLQPVITYGAIEPRFSMKYSLPDKSSIKASVTPTTQYIHLVSNSNSTLPADVWVPSSSLVRPQRGIQYAIGYFKNFLDNNIETSIELYYKSLWDQIDYSEFYVNNPAEEVERSFVYGKGRSYGFELLISKVLGRWNGWIGYTYSKTERSFSEINEGNWFPVRYDRTHDVDFVLNYQLNPKWEFGAVFVYATGNTYTPLKSLFISEQNLNVEYGTRNSARIPNYHRMDVSVTYNPAFYKTKKFKSSWNFSVYNVYNRLNPAFIYTDVESDISAGTATARAVKVSLFPIIPSITWNFKWNQ